MHYYQFNIGDYHSHTGYLSLMEDLAYRRLLDQYYLQEIPLPSDAKEIARKIGMSDYLEEVEQILADFFTLNDAGEHINKRVDEEISQYRAKADTARVNGKKGGRPKKPDSNPEETQQEPRKTQPVILANPEETGLKANQEPITNNQEPITKEKIKDMSPLEADTKSKVPYSKILDLYHSTLPGHPQIKVLSEKRKAHIRQTWKNYLNTLEDWEEYFRIGVATNNFLSGKAVPVNGRKPWIADFDWLINQNNAIKVSEGKYNEQV